MTTGNKILIADDEPDILEIIEFNLQAQGYDVTTARNGDEALEKAKKILNYQPSHNLEKGLKEAVEWYWFKLK